MLAGNHHSRIMSEAFISPDLLERLPAAVILFVGDRLRYVNPATADLLEAESPQVLIGRSVMEFIHPLDQARITARIRRAEQSPHTNPPTEFRIHTCKGNLRVVGLTSVTYETGETNGVLAVFMDMTARSEMEARLRESDENFRAMLENMQDVFYRTDAEGITRFVCPAVRNVLGFEAEEIIGRPAADFYPDPNDRQILKDAILRDGAVRDFPGQMVCKDGRVIDISISTRALYDEEGQFAGVEGIWRDITERRNLERELERRATIDPLTGIHNRAAILDRIVEGVSRSRRHNRPFTLLSLDLDHFKAVNDRHGHLAGDHVLRCFADVVLGQLRSEDHFGRLGGEEFCILLEELEREKAEKVAERIRAAVDDMVFQDVQAGSLSISVSIGGVYCSADVQSIEQLLDIADHALYEAKRNGRNRVFWMAGGNCEG
jgi:diguanylate cyclase (GGDEF)-like protein/PAS domain S-box-containing protein